MCEAVQLGDLYVNWAGNSVLYVCEALYILQEEFTLYL
jgi:hypothetical protein